MEPHAKIEELTPSTTIVVLPAFNEEHRIGNLLGHIRRAMYESSLQYKVILIDDGSTDQTFTLATEYTICMPLNIVRHEKNKGLGQTIRDGLFLAADIAADHDIIVTMDADDTHTPGLIQRMVRMILEGYDVVVASRYQHKSRIVGVPFFRRALSFWASQMMRILFPIPGIKDYTCGFRAYRASVIKKAIKTYGDNFLNQDGFQCMVDILLKLRKTKTIFGEVPFILRYDIKEGGTKMKIGSTITKTLILLVKRKFSSQP